jgi:hypothetical protein
VWTLKPSAITKSKACYLRLPGWTTVIASTRRRTWSACRSSGTAARWTCHWPRLQRLLSFVDDPARHCADVNELVDAQLGRVRARLASMQALEKQLVQLRARCGPPQASPAGGAGAVSEAGAADQADGAACGILAELVSAAHGEACACHPGEALA